MTIVKQAPVEKVTLGRSGMVSTRLGLGTASWPHRISLQESITMLQEVMKAGLRHIDCAPAYQTEHIIGQAMQEIDCPPDIVLATKAGSYSEDSLGFKGRDYSADTFYRSVERSLHRFGTDYIDILHIHDAGPQHMKQVFAPDGALAALQDLKSQGVIGAIGMGALTLRCLQEAAESGSFDVLQIFHTYTLLNQSAATKLLPYCQQNNISIFNSAPYAGYILATGAVPDARYNYSPASAEVIDAVRHLETVCSQKGVDLPAAAVAFAARHPAVDVVVIASGKPKRIAQWIDAIHSPLTDTDFDELLRAAGGQYDLPRG
ncbi:MAG: aldo/keto reductase [Anaerolineae bacterium]|nr:aldo/keto reductase [Anaerolineae bacterium]